MRKYGTDTPTNNVAIIQNALWRLCAMPVEKEKVRFPEKSLELDFIGNIMFGLSSSIIVFSFLSLMLEGYLFSDRLLICS
jgi:hypothetical protein